jgi:hypothetical protein
MNQSFLLSSNELIINLPKENRPNKISKRKRNLKQQEEVHKIENNRTNEQSYINRIIIINLCTFEVDNSKPHHKESIRVLTKFFIKNSFNRSWLKELGSIW